METIRYYERRGLVASLGRSASGRRVFDDGDIQRLRFIRRCRDLGFPLEDIDALLSAADCREAECEQVLDIGRRHLAAVRDRIGELRQLESALEDLLADCESARTPCCPMLDGLLRDPVR